jgi:hypothetical protein
LLFLAVISAQFLNRRGGDATLTGADATARTFMMDNANAWTIILRELHVRLQLGTIKPDRPDRARLDVRRR